MARKNIIVNSISTHTMPLETIRTVFQFLAGHSSPCRPRHICTLMYNEADIVGKPIEVRVGDEVGANTFGYARLMDRKGQMLAKNDRVYLRSLIANPGTPKGHRRDQITLVLHNACGAVNTLVLTSSRPARKVFEKDITVIPERCVRYTVLGGRGKWKDVKRAVIYYDNKAPKKPRCIKLYA